MECRDEGEEVSEDSEDSNAEDYYDRICEAYGEEECDDSDFREDWEQEESSYGSTIIAFLALRTVTMIGLTMVIECVCCLVCEWSCFFGQ